VLQVDEFAADTHQARRIAVEAHTFEVRDNLQPVEAGLDRAWRRMLGCHISSRTPRSPSLKALSLTLDAVRPDPTQGMHIRQEGTHLAKARARNVGHHKSHEP
jgi:hypothetical protein